MLAVTIHLDVPNQGINLENVRITKATILQATRSAPNSRKIEHSSRLQNLQINSVSSTKVVTNHSACKENPTCLLHLLGKAADKVIPTCRPSFLVFDALSNDLVKFSGWAKANIYTTFFVFDRKFSLYSFYTMTSSVQMPNFMFLAVMVLIL